MHFFCFVRLSTFQRMWTQVSCRRAWVIDYTIFSFSIVFQNLILASVVICKHLLEETETYFCVKFKLKAKPWRVFFLFSLAPQSWPSVSFNIFWFQLVRFSNLKTGFCLLIVEFEKLFWFKLCLCQKMMSILLMSELL